MIRPRKSCIQGNPPTHTLNLIRTHHWPVIIVFVAFWHQLNEHSTKLGLKEGVGPPCSGSDEVIAKRVKVGCLVCYTINVAHFLTKWDCIVYCILLCHLSTVAFVCCVSTGTKRTHSSHHETDCMFWYPDPRPPRVDCWLLAHSLFVNNSVKHILSRELTFNTCHQMISQKHPIEPTREEDQISSSTTSVDNWSTIVNRVRWKSFLFAHWTAY